MRIRNFSKFSWNKVIRINIISSLLYLILIYLVISNKPYSISTADIFIFTGPFFATVLSMGLSFIIPLFIKPLENFSDNMKQYIALIIFNLIVGVWYLIYIGSPILSFIHVVFSKGAMLTSIGIKHSNVKINKIKRSNITL